MPGISPITLVLTLFAVWSVDSVWLFSQDQSGETLPGRSTPSQPDSESFWLDNTLDPDLRRIPPPDDLSIVDNPRLDEHPLGTRSLGEGRRTPFTARLSWIPQRDLKNQPNELAINGEEIELAFPLRLDADGIWLALGSVQRLEISTSACLPDSGLPVPNQLWDVEVGTMHLRDLGDGWSAGGMFRVGSPSDRPFVALRDMTVTLLGFLTVPSSERDAWNFSLFYSPTGQIVFPIPGVAYVWRPNCQFQANLGIPFSLEYQPTETLALTASYRPLTNLEAIARQSLGESWSVYGGYRTVCETFLLADRVNDRERTYVFDQRLMLGLQRELGRGWSFDLSAAYVFDRQVFQAEKFSGSRRDELAIDPGLAGTLQLLWTR